MKKNQKNVITVISIIVVILLLLYLGGFLDIANDDYNTYDGFGSDSVILNSGNEKWTISQNGCDISLSDGFLRIEGHSGCSFTISTKDLKGYDFKTAFNLDVQGTRHNSASGSISVGINQNDVCSLSASGTSRIQKNVLSEITQNRANQDVYNGNCNGIDLSSEFPAGENTELTYTGQLTYSLAYIDYLKTRPFFSCEIQQDEVLVKDTFSAGQFGYSDLSFKPFKFCTTDFPVLIQEVGTGVTSDKRGDITTKLSYREPIIVPEGRIYIVGYIADYSNGMKERCSVGQSYNTKLGKCEQYATEESDIIEVVREVKFIEVGKNEFTFTNSGSIGDLSISSSAPKFTCSDTYATAPNPNEGCWNIPVTAGNGAFNPIYGKEFLIKTGIVGKAFTEAVWENGILRNNKYTNTILVTINDLFDVIPSFDKAYFVNQNEEAYLYLTIDNKVANFKDAGVKIVIDNKLLNTEETKFVSFPITLGENTYKIKKETGQLGQFEYKITPFVTISGKNVFDNQQVTYSYEVIQKVTPQELIVKNEQITLIQKKCGFWCNLWEKIKAIFR